MNVDTEKIYKAVIKNGQDIAVLTERQLNQHKENQKSVDILHKRINKINGSEIGKLSVHIKTHWILILLLLTGLLGISWTTLK